MKNPSEELTTAWLQECKGFFTMSNIKVPKPKGGMGAEIDILATNKRKNIWVEVSVSTHPRRNYRADVLFAKSIEDSISDFQREDKRRKVEEFFGKRYECWFVYGKLPMKKEHITKFPKEIEKHGVRAIYFGDIFKDLMKLRHYRLDAARGYMNLFIAFHEEK